MTAVWTYSQRTGEMCDPSGACVAAGYSGAKPWVNLPRAEDLKDKGPIPTGAYTIGAAVTHDTCGPVSLPLEPSAMNSMYGRDGFLIHGDSIDAPGTASTGCIIMPRAVRDMMEASDCRDLVVTT